jgi:hypothetical protein
MSSSMLLERSNCAVAPVGQLGSVPGNAAIGGQWNVLPRCEISFEKCTGGFKIHCRCEDEVGCGTLQQLCRMLCEGTCSVCCTCNGIQVCQCNLTIGFCSCENTADGVCLTCISGDSKCCDMLQAFCDCLACCCNSGCCCYVSFNNTPVCCGRC